LVALVVSAALLFLGTAAVLAFARRRPPGKGVTWGEAMVAAAFVYLLMGLAYGIVPHQWLTFADNELGWRSDKIVYGPGNVLSNIPFTITYQVIRDIIVAGIYIVFLGGQIALWAVWQGRGKAKQRELATSSFGRPLVKGA